MKAKLTHVLERTSPKGEAFIGRCRLCGKENLSMKDALADCPNPKRISSAEALTMAIEGETRGDS